MAPKKIAKKATKKAVKRVAKKKDPNKSKAAVAAAKNKANKKESKRTQGDTVNSECRKLLLEKKWIRVAVAARDGRLTLLTKRRRVSPSGKNACWPLINQAQHCYRSYQKTSRPTPLDC